MADTYWPFDGIDTTETQYSQLIRRMQMSGVWGQPSDNACKAYGDSSGLFVKLPAGPAYAFVRGHMYQRDAAIASIAVAAGGTGARTDMLVIRLDPTANTILPAILPGTNGAPGTIPVPTQTDAGIYELEICLVAVAASASTITAGNITDIRKFAGHVFGMWTTANRPVSPRTGHPGFNTDLGQPEYHDGTTWKTFSVDPLTTTAGDSKKVNGSRITVSPTAPTTPAPVSGDLWFW